TQSIEAPEVEEIVMKENIALQEPQSILNTYNIETIPEFKPEILSARNLHMETTKAMEDIRVTEDIKDTDSNNNRNKEVLENIKDLDSRSGDRSVVVRLPDCHARGLGFKSYCRRI